MHAAVASRIKIMAGLDISERRLPQDGGIHVMMDKRPIDLRVSTMPGKHGEKVVIRIIDNDKASVNLEKLGFGYETLKALAKADFAAQRNSARDRPDRQRQKHDALCRASRK